jgi:hypothetical protein
MFSALAEPAGVPWAEMRLQHDQLEAYPGTNRTSTTDC